MSGVRRYRLTGPRAPGEPAEAEDRGRRVKYAIYFDADLFHQLRRRAERENSCVGDVVCEMIERAMGG